MNNSHKKSWLKTILIAVVAVLSLVLIVACDNGPTDQSLVNQAKENLGVTFKNDDSFESVTENFTVATTVSSDNGNITITWESDDTNVISFSGSTGRVTRPTDNDKEVKITASLKLNNATASRDFSLTVVKQVSAAEALSLVELEEATYDETTDRYTTTSDLTLPETSLGYDIEWLSSNTEVIAVDGTVTRPAWNSSDALVQLTASIGEEERHFVVSVPKVEEKPTSDKLDDAYDALLIPGLDVDVVRTDLVLPSEAGSEGVTVTWVSSDPTLLSNDGKIVLIPDEITPVTLTATLSLDGETLEKVFQLRVAAGEPTLYDGDIAGLIAAAKNEDLKDKYVVIYDATIVALTKDGFIILDNSDKFLFVYTKTEPNPKTYVVGNVYNVYGTYENYYGSPQLKDWDEGIIRVTASDAPVSDVEPTKVTSVNDYIESLVALENKTGDPFNTDNPLEMRYVEITAKVRVQGTGNYDVLLVEPDYDGPNINTGTTAPSFNENAIMIYYQSNINTIRAFDDILITAKFYVNARRTNNNIYAVVFTGEEADIEFNLTTEQKLSKAKNTVSIPNQIVEDTTLNLMDKVDDVVITWEVLEGEDLINLTNGNVTLPATGNELLKLKATFSVDGETETKEYSITVGEPDIISISDAKTAEKGEILKVKGVVIGMSGNNKISIQDETGAIALYGKNLAGADVNVGDLVTVLGTKDIYNELHQVSSYTIKEKEAGTLPAPVDINDKDLNKTDLLPYQSMAVSLDNMIVSNVKLSTGSSYDTFTMTLERLDGEKISFRWESRVAFDGSENLTSIENGDVVNVVGGMVDWYNGPQLTANADGQFVKLDVLPDDVTAILASRELKLDNTDFEESGTLTLPTTITGFDGVTVSWSLFNSDDEDFLDIDTGEVTVVADEYHEVLLIATVTMGTVDVNVEFTIKVGDKDLDEVKLHEYDFESGKQNGYIRAGTTTLGVDGGLNWEVTTASSKDSGILWNFIENDGPLGPEQGENAARIHGKNETSITSEAIPYVTRITMDAKYYGTSSASKLEVFAKGDGDDDFVLLQDLALTAAYQSFEIEVNKENVQIRLTGKNERSNFDNLTIYGTSTETEDLEDNHIELDFTKLSDSTDYVTTPTDFSVDNESGGEITLTRLNSNISTVKVDNEPVANGVVLVIRDKNDWESPWLKTADKLNGVTKVEFKVTNWTSDAGYNIDFADKIVIQTSEDGENWTDSEDFKPDWDKSNLGLNTLTLELGSPSDVYIRLFVESAGTQAGYQLRLIVTSMEVWLS